MQYSLEFHTIIAMKRIFLFCLMVATINGYIVRAESLIGPIVVHRQLDLKWNLLIWKKIPAGNYKAKLNVSSIKKQVSLEIIGSKFRFANTKLKLPIDDSKVSFPAKLTGQKYDLFIEACSRINHSEPYTQNESCLYKRESQDECYYDMNHNWVCHRVYNDVYGNHQVTRKTITTDRFYTISLMLPAIYDSVASMQATTRVVKSHLLYETPCEI